MSLAVVRDVTLEPTRRRVDVREVIHDLRRRYPRVGEDRLAEMVCDRLEEDRHLLLAASRLLVHQIVAAAEAREPQRRAASAPVRVRREAVNRVEVRRAVAKVREAALLDLPVTLLSGETKQLRYCLGRELSELGTAFSRIAERVEPDEMLGERLTEAEVRGLLAAGA
jgi:hypothetical protein